MTPLASSETRIQQLTITEQEGEGGENRTETARSQGGSSSVMCSVAASTPPEPPAALEDAACETHTHTANQ